MPKKVLLATGNKPEHFALIDVLMETGVLCGAVIQTNVKTRFPDEPLFVKYEADQFNAIHKFFGVKYSHTSNLPSKAVCHEKINCSETADFINKLSPDLMINFDTENFTTQTLSQIKCEKWKIHSGAVEKFKGWDCNFWACYEGLPQYVCHTVHLMDDDTQSGDIIHSTSTAFRPEDTIQDMDKRSLRRLVNDIPELMAKYSADNIKYLKQKEKGRFFAERDIKENHLKKIYEEIGNKYENITVKR